LGPIGKALVGLVTPTAMKRFFQKPEKIFGS